MDKTLSFVSDAGKLAFAGFVTFDAYQRAIAQPTIGGAIYEIALTIAAGLAVFVACSVFAALVIGSARAAARFTVRAIRARFNRTTR